MIVAKFNRAIEKAAICESLTDEEAYCLVKYITPEVLHLVGNAALMNRRLRYDNYATYISNLHINPSNICKNRCVFCNYSASEIDKHAYVINEDEIFSKIDKYIPTEVHIVGGLNQIWSYFRSLNLIKLLRKRYPNLYIKAFTAVEIEYFAQTSKCTEYDVLSELKESGLNAITGGGAELFSKYFYKKYWEDKTTQNNWIRIHKIAHKMDITSNATMLFGIGETWVDRVKHLLILRNLQKVSNGFVSFIPLPFQSINNNFINKGPSPLEIIFVLALSRIILHNISHIKAYWPMLGIPLSSVGLSWGADDIDGTVTEEKIAHFSGASTPVGLSKEKMIETISIGGFTPIERKGDFSLK